MAKEGRPNKYGTVISKLKLNKIYSPASIAKFASRSGLLDQGDPEETYRRIRISLARMTHMKSDLFPFGGDGQVMQKGQPPMPGWFGWRWKQAYNVNSGAEHE